MPDNQIIVGAVSRVERGAAAGDLGAQAQTNVLFGDGSKASLDPRDPRSEQFAAFLDDLGKAGALVSVEVDAGTRYVTMVHIPLEVTVEKIVAASNGDTEVRLEISQAKHFVRAKNARRAALIGLLERARDAKTVVLVTETDDHDIIDVRPAPARPDGGRFRLLTTKLAPAEPPATCVSPQKAQQLFALCAATTCSPVTVPPPCIPFMYPDNGCWARAHEMCRLILAQGVQPKKVWIQGNLDAKTRNKPNCHVQWAWHVAPIICVEDYAGRRMEVIDPSLFTGPVTEAVWKGAQGDPAATLTETDAALYYGPWMVPNQYDPTYAQTAADLTKFRNLLRARSINVGPPPYANCP